MPRLPIWHTIVAAYRQVQRHLGVYSAQAVVFAAPSSIAAVIVPGLGDGRAEAQSAPDLASDLSEFLAGFCLVYGMVTVGVECHRAVVLRAQPTFGSAFGFGRREIKVVGVGLVWMLMVFLSILLWALVLGPFIGFDLAHPQPESLFFVATVTIPVTLLWNFLAAPMAFAFTLAAIDETEVYRQSLRLSRGFRLRLGSIMFLASVPFVWVWWVLLRLLPEPRDALSGALVAGADALLAIGTAAYVATAVALAYSQVARTHIGSVCSDPDD